ncbi:DUF4344 domain-containing metallopeptidase [Enterovibrio nigricans]|uniref:Putative metallopeptidase n=1 Tax=Enterovibrio nigricans DSM 22720 TaxID=1121868 RepID=A0A1T4U1Z7_9GAMM|nr:DUF4344 domain-containing metallopeptidase [Enterovibrio nigricans]PKF51158.1 hypothetical protein AT251_06105 [Enterovibrio nigricans]SKA46660.1 Putative metallopeptidase [Enterovibrio nigricans DSM 22720]
MRIRFHIYTLALLFLLPVTQSMANTVLVFDPPTSKNDRQAKRLIESISKDMVQLVNAEMPVPEILTIRYGNLDGPLFDPQTLTIQMPYQFVHYAKERFDSVPPSQEDLTSNEATEAAVLHTLLHEYGHAYLALWDFPALGKEEDAVDNFATLMMLHYYNDDMAYAGVDLFAIEDMDTEYFDDVAMWDEHSLDGQRYAQSLCLIYGSNPKKYADIMDEDLIEMERDQFCPYEFELQTRNWMRVIEMLNENE